MVIMTKENIKYPKPDRKVVLHFIWALWSEEKKKNLRKKKKKMKKTKKKTKYRKKTFIDPPVGQFA